MTTNTQLIAVYGWQGKDTTLTLWALPELASTAKRIAFRTLTHLGYREEKIWPSDPNGPHFVRAPVPGMYQVEFNGKSYEIFIEIKNK